MPKSYLGNHWKLDVFLHLNSDEALCTSTIQWKVCWKISESSWNIQNF